MAMDPELLRRIAAAHQEALRVGDSPQRADQLADRLAALGRDVGASGAGEETRVRVARSLAEAERVLRRDDDGREAARRIQEAQRHAEERPRRPPPF